MTSTNIQDSEKIAKAIYNMHTELSALDISHMEHYNRCRINGSVPTVSNKRVNGWYHDTSPSALIMLYIRLPDHVKPFVIKPRDMW